MAVNPADATSLLTGSAAIQLGLAALQSAEQSQASMLELFPPPQGITPAQYGQLGQTTATRGTLLNIVV
jgi:hypothetical protein